MWQSILSPVQRESANRWSDAIVTELTRSAATTTSAWCAAQTALLAWESGRLRGSGDLEPLAERLAHRATDLTARTPLRGSFFRGLVGVAWVLEVIHETDTEAETETETETDDHDVDTVIADLVSQEPVPHVAYFDLVSGLVGKGLYFLARPSSPRTLAALDAIVYRLEETAEYVDDGIAWWGHTVLGPNQGVACYNLGLAHGVPGIIAFLARALRRGISPQRCRFLLEGAVEWTLRQQLSSGPSRYPTYVDRSGRPDGPARAAWCYGDPGVALALFAAASATGRSDWRDAAHAIAAWSARRPIGTCAVADTSVCHGSSGSMHIYNRLFQATGDPVFERAALAWFRSTLDLLEAGAWDGVPASDDPADLKAANILEGKAGVALALASAASSRAPTWDRLLLADLEPWPAAAVAEVVA